MVVIVVTVIAVVIGVIITSVISVAAPLGLTGWWFKKMRDQEAQTRALLASGESAEATILNMWDTGMTINDNPRVGLLLEVRPPGRAPFQVEMKRTISRLQISLYQPGTVVQVRYDPNDTTKVAIEQIRMPRRAAAEVSGEDRPMPQALVCPSCGAPLDYEAAMGPTVPCPYCDTSVVVPDELRD
jgi:hypothetical protein